MTFLRIECHKNQAGGSRMQLEAAATDDQNASQPTGLDTISQQVGPESVQLSQEDVCLRREREVQKPGQKQQRHIISARRGKDCVMCTPFLLYGRILFICTINFIIAFDTSSIQPVWGGTYVTPAVPETDVVKEFWKLTNPLFGSGSTTSSSIKWASQATRSSPEDAAQGGEKPEQQQQQQQKRTDKCYTEGQPLHDQIRPQFTPGTHGSLVVHRPPAWGSHAPLSVDDNPGGKERENHTDSDGVADGLTVSSQEEERGADQSRSAVVVGAATDEVSGAHFGDYILSAPPWGAREEPEHPAFIPAAGRISGSFGGATGASMAFVKAMPNRLSDGNVPAVPGGGTAAGQIRSTAVFSAGGDETSGAAYQENGTVEIARSVPGAKRENHIPSLGNAPEYFSPASKRKKSGMHAQSEPLRPVIAEEHERQRSYLDEMLPIAAAIVEAAKLAAPEVLQQSLNAGERATPATSAKNQSCIGSTGQTNVEPVCHLKALLVKTLRLVLLQEVPEKVSTLITAIRPPLPTDIFKAEQHDYCTTSLIEMSSAAGRTAGNKNIIATQSAHAATPAFQGKDGAGVFVHPGEVVDKKHQPISLMPDARGMGASSRRVGTVLSELEKQKADIHIADHLLGGGGSAVLPAIQDTLNFLGLLWWPVCKKEDGDAACKAEALRPPETTDSVFRGLKTSPSTRYRGLYTFKGRLEERWLWELQPSYSGGGAVKVRASFGKAPAAFKNTCTRVGNWRCAGTATVCASLYAAEEIIEQARANSERESDDVDDIIKNMAYHSRMAAYLRRSTTPAPHPLPATRTKTAGQDHVVSLNSEQAAEIEKLLSSLAVETETHQVAGAPVAVTCLDSYQALPKPMEGKKEKSQYEPLKAKPDPARNRAPQGAADLVVSWGPSTETLNSVTEVIDMTELGEVAFFNIEAFLRQQACGNLYSTLLLDSDHPRPRAECVIRSLSAHANKIAERAPIRTGSMLVKIFARIFCVLKNDEIALDLLRSAQIAVAKSTRNSEVANTGALVNMALRSRPESVPFFIALVTSRKLEIVHREIRFLTTRVALCGVSLVAFAGVLA